MTQFNIDPQPITFKPDSAPQAAPTFKPDPTPIHFTPDSQPQTAPQPQSTPHDLDSYVQSASGKYGIQPSVLRALGLQESGLGHGAGYNPKTGLDTDPSNKGVGPWQVDPSSGATPEQLGRIRRDPQYAADFTAGIMQRNLAHTHGDLRGALAMYNTGSATSPVGLRYADQVIARMGTLDPMQFGPLKVDPETGARINYHVHHLSTAMRNTKDPLKAMSHTSELAPLTRLENGKKAAWHWFKEHPLEGFGDILGTGMREGQFIMPYLLDPQHYHQAINQSQRAEQLREFNQLVWHPTEQNTAKAQEAFRKAFNTRFQALTGIPDYFRSNAELDAGIKQHIWKPLVPATSATAQTVNDFIQQAIPDPFTYIDFGANTIGRMAGPHIHAMVAHGAPYMERALRGAGGVMRGVHALMPQPVRDAYSHLPGWIQGAEGMARDLFGVRRDLDKAGFTRDGKHARMSIENRHDAVYTGHVNQVKRIAHDPEATAQYIADHADHLTLLNRPLKRGSGSPLHNLIDRVEDQSITPEERERLANQAFRQQRNRNITSDTMNTLAGNERMFAGNPNDILQLNMDRISNVQQWANDRPSVMKTATNIGKRAILYNSLPHGLINEGSLVYMAGGLNALVHGLSAMAMPMAEKDIQFLKEYGALPEHMLPNFGGGNVLATADQAVLHFSQNVLEHMELGWRIGLMKTLEQELGPVTSEEDKLMRGWLINEKAGDYRNQSAFTEFFRGLGGPFTAFHLGIVPKAFVTTLMKNPSLIKNYQRLGQDIENDAAGHKEIADYSPFAEGAKFVADTPAVAKGELPKYVSDTLNDYQDFLDTGKDEEGAVQHWLKIAEHYFAPYKTVESLGKIEQGRERPGHKATLPEQLMDVILWTLGKEYARTPNAKYQSEEYSKIHKGSI